MVPRTRCRDVQQPRVLSVLVTALQSGQAVHIAQREAATAALRADAHSDITGSSVKTVDFGAVPRIPAQAGDEHDGKLQTFGAVDRQNTHGVFIVVDAGALVVQYRLARSMLHPGDESAQALR